MLLESTIGIVGKGLHLWLVAAPDCTMRYNDGKMYPSCGRAPEMTHVLEERSIDVQVYQSLILEGTSDFHFFGFS